jgi:CHAT domain-containing protein/CBASS immunity sensor of nucleotide second messenger signals
MEYQDFTIDIRSAGSGRFEATANAVSFRDTPRVYFLAPIEKEALQSLHASFDRPGTEIGKGLPEEMSPRKLGERLYSALFQGEMADLLVRCRAAVPPDERSGLRLRLRFQINDPEAAYLAALPWEWLWDPRAAEFLSADLGTPLVRDLAAAQPRGALHVEPPLRILVVDAAPGTMKELNLKLEIERMAEALGLLMDGGQVELLQLARATPEELRDVLRDEEIHVLHFMGHGGYHPGSGMGAVFFVGDQGKKDQVDGEMFAAYLKRIPSLRLVVLNACKTALHAGKMGAPLCEGVASAVLERTGVPAVVANQYSISDPAAIAFSETFYGRIAAGDGVDEALTEARLRLRHRTSEWATPVLFLTAPDGKLFAMEPTDPVARRRSVLVARPQPEAAVPVRLGVRSFVGWGRDMEARNDAVLDLTQYFDPDSPNGRFIKEKEWWQEKVFPDLRTFLLASIDERRPLLLDFAAHSSIAFAAGWLLEPKSGLDVRVRQRTGSEGEFEWSPTDGREPEGCLWLDRPDVELDAEAPDVAAALSVSQPAVAEHVKEFIRREGCPIGRIVDAVVPEPGPRSVRGGAHSLRLAQALLPRVRQRRPHEREGRVHFFCAAPNALVFYLGQLASSLERVVLYEFPFRVEGSYGRYQKSIELPPPGEAKRIPEGW